MFDVPYATRTKNDNLTVPERFSSVDVVIRYLITMDCIKKRALDIIPAIKQKSWTVYERHSVRLPNRYPRELWREFAPYICFPVDSFCIVIGIV